MPTKKHDNTKVHSSKIKTKTKTICWILIVLFLSFLCYLPMLLQKQGLHIPAALLNAKYLFVLTPLACSIIVEISEHTLKQWFLDLFTSKKIFHSILICILFIITGLMTSYIYSITKGNQHLFYNVYPSISFVIINGIYLFIMALLEEAAWRGFFLKRISNQTTKIHYILCTGIIWGLWHIPMWYIRNSLTIKEILFFFIWTILLSLVIGFAYYNYQNIFILAFLHTIFNTCFLAPVEWNIILLIIIFFIFALFTNLFKNKKCSI